MSFLKQMYFFLSGWLPPKVFPYVVRCCVFGKYLFDSRKGILNKNITLKGKGGRDAYLLATGPSLKDMDLSFLKDKDCFSVSNFFLHEQLGLISPKLHFFAPYHEPLILEEYVEWLREADKKLPKSTGIVLGVSTKKIVKENDLFKAREVFYLDLEKMPVFNVPDLKWPILAPQTSPIMVLPVLHYMGYENVYLLGCDHNILKDYGGVVSNFYENDRDPRSNATSGRNWDDGIIKHLENAKNVFLQYKYYDEIFSKTGRKIYNVSKNGWLDFINYISFDDLKKK